MSRSVCHGVTLLEVVIAMGIFLSVMALAMESLVSSQRYRAVAEAQDQVHFDIDSVTRRISADMSASGWYFYGQEDSNGNGVLDPGEDIDGDGLLNEVEYQSVGNDRRLRYYPYLRANTPPAIGTAFPTRAEPGQGPYTRWTPWTSAAYPGWSSGSVAALADTVTAEMARGGLLVTSDLAREMAQPSNDIIYLRVATSAWNVDPTDADRQIPGDMTFFPGYSGGPLSSGDTQVVPAGGDAYWRTRGSRAYDWRQPTNWANLPRSAQGEDLVLRPSAWIDDGSGNFVHINSLLPTSDPNYMKPYGVPMWGAVLDDASSGPRLRMQWETILADRMYQDPTEGQDDEQRPDDLREFCYAVIPSPTGFGRLVRAHSVLASGTRVLGQDQGDWITDPTNARGYQIDLVLSDDIVRATWTTRRHDRTLAANQVRLRLVVARPSTESVNGLRLVSWRIVENTFAMLARNEYDDQVAAEEDLDVSATLNNIPFVY